MRYLAIAEIVELHRRLIVQSGGSDGIRDHGALFASVAQPRQTFAGEDLYPTLVDKAAALGFFLCSNHPFVDGNKRVAHASLEVMLFLNGLELSAPIDDQEQTMLELAAGRLGRDEFTMWVRNRVVARRN